MLKDGLVNVKLPVNYSKAIKILHLKIIWEIFLNKTGWQIKSGALPFQAKQKTN
jgi:hypothetical protein